MEKNNTVTHVMPTQSGVVTQAPGQTHVVPTSRILYKVQIFWGPAMFEISARIISMAFSIAILIAAIVTLSALNSGSEYEYSDGSRGAAGWMVFVAIAALIFHLAMIIVRVLYTLSVIEKNFSGYVLTNAIFCAILGLALLSGGIASAVYGSNNSDHYDDTVHNAEFATVAFSAVSLLMLIVLFINFLQCGIHKWHEEANQSSEVTIPSSPYYSLE